MSNETLEKSIKFIVQRTIELKQKFLNITFFGGEPTLRMDAIKRAVKQTKKLVKENSENIPSDFQMQFAVNTNGTLLNDEIIRYFQKEKFKIYLSLDGPARKHDISRRTIGGKGCFSLLKPYIPTLSKMDTSIISVVTRNHVCGLARAIEWIVSQGFTNITTSIDFDGKWTGEDMDKLAAEYQKLALLWLKYRERGKKIYLGMIQDKISFRLLDVRQKEYTCFIYKGGVGIAANGNIFPCSRFITSDPDAKYILGNVHDSEKKQFNAAVVKDIKNFLNHDKPDCKDCAIRYRCSAHECGCTAFFTTGSIHGVSPEVCTHERILAAICDDVLAKRQAHGNFC